MSAVVNEPPKIEDAVTIEVDGQPLQARKGAMLMEVTDAAGIYIPRFCYHKKLSVAANCRMCLVEVERAPKPQPACATPVMDGMKVFTKSPKAVSGQQATMEFLLINHPLDCPICDQGGECELQDLALGYGSAVSQFTERKRVVRDKNIGPLVQTDMTRCIHCTRCVRFGEEVAGLRELGATGRGEHVEIGTYVAQAMTSELSGNVIDLCPVGALTSKPYRYSARAWELRQFDGIAPHDGIGANVHVHVKGQVVKRVVPKENEAVNETWLSDRDRFAYQGLNHPERLLSPRIKEHGVWRDCDWDTALAACSAALSAAGNRVAAAASPSSTNEELFLLQRLVRGLGSHAIEHRLRQADFTANADESLFPFLGLSLAELERADVIVLVGAYPRHEIPLLNHRIRKAAERGARVIAIDTVDQPFNFNLAGRLTVKPNELESVLAALAGVQGHVPHAAATALAEALRGGARAVVLAGARVQAHPRRSALLGLCTTLAHRLGACLGLIAEGANAAGAWLAGAVPHREAGGRAVSASTERGLPAKVFLLLGVEPDADYRDPVYAAAALTSADQVIGLTAFCTLSLAATCTVLLPIASFGENEGSFVNLCGEWQTFSAVVKPPGEARAAWKIFRALGERLALAGFDAVTSGDVTQALRAVCGASSIVPASYPLVASREPAQSSALARIDITPLYRVDSLTRRASALQNMPQSGDDAVHVSAATLAKLGLRAGTTVGVQANGIQARGILVVDAQVPDDCCLLYATRAVASLLPASVTVTLHPVGE